MSASLGERSESCQRNVPASITESARETLSPATYRDSLNRAVIGRQIADLQAALPRLAKDKTEQLYLAAVPSALPEVRSAIRIKTPTAS